MDDCERAQEAQARDNNIALLERKRLQSTKVSTGYCEECDVKIPQARVDAINATTCIECAVMEELRVKQWR